jgi:hypothetical protein
MSAVSYHTKYERGDGWCVVRREGDEELVEVEGFITRQEALQWISDETKALEEVG